MCGFSVLCVSLSRSDPRARHPQQFPKSVLGVLWEGWRGTSYGQKELPAVGPKAREAESIPEK